MFKSNFTKIIVNSVLLLLIISCIIWHELIIYGINQGKGQLKIVLKSESVENAINNHTYNNTLTQKITLIQEVKQFAFDSIGINYSKNYSTIYNQWNQPSMYVVTACRPYSFEAKEWTFPLIGSVSYKGFFDKTKAQKEAYLLKLQGFDVSIYSPTGWSTLGWFKDPILSNMLKKSDSEIINTIIHELTHGTLYVKNNVDFNENLANFIAEKGTEKFILNKFGENSILLNKFYNDKKDNKIYTTYMLKAYATLDSLYSTSRNDSAIDLKKEKNKIITSIVRGINGLNLSNQKAYFNFTLKAFSEENAFFMSFNRYDSMYDKFEKEFVENYHSNLSEYLKFLKNKYPSL